MLFPVEKILLSPIEQRYVSTCYPLEDRPRYDEAMAWKKKLQKSAIAGEPVEVDAGDFGRAFPHVGRLYSEKLFDEISFLHYFEGTDQNSHNMRAYLFAKNVAKKNIPREIMRSVIHHLTVCSVRVARLEDSRVWSYGGSYSMELDRTYFGDSQFGQYAFLHGRSEKGPVVVRTASEEEFEKLSSWFERIHSKNKKSPFFGFDELIELPSS